MHKHSIRLAAVLLAGLAVVGCSSSDNTYTCNFSTSIGYCYQWTTPDSLSSSQISQLEATCTAGGGAGAGTFTTGGSCPTTNRAGICTFSNSGISYQWVLYTPTWDAATGQTYCTSGGGTWTAG